mgnify:CR=1 FL=1
MGKLEKSFYWLCFALLVYITIGFKLIPAVLKDQLIKNLDENLTQKTTIEKIEFNPFIFKLTVHGFKLSDSNDITSVTFKNFSVDFDAIKSIKRSSITFDGISLKDVFINIIEEKDGSVNLAKLVKPTDTIEEKKEEENTSIIDFLVSKLELVNANISYTKQEDNYTLDLKDINYTLYDLGTYKKILSSNDLKFKLNEHTNISIGGAFKLEPFRGYGKISIEDLRIKDFLAYKKELLNFDLDEKANLNLQLNYDFHANKDFALNINSDKFEFNNINLKQNEANILALEKLDIKTFVFNLDRQNIRLDNIDFKDLKTNMILDKNGINLANLIKETKTQEKVKEETKVPALDTKTQTEPWNIDVSNIKINNGDFIFDDKENSVQAQSKAFNVGLNNLKITGSDINLNKLEFLNPNITFTDNKNKLDFLGKNTNINLANLSLIKGALNIDKINLTEDSLNFNDKKSNLSLLSKKVDISLNSLKIADNKTSIDIITLKTPNLNFDDLKSKLKVDTSNIDINVKSLLVDGKKTSINSLGLKNLDLNFDDKNSKMNLKSSNINLDVNSLIIDDKKTTVNSVELKTPKLNFNDFKSKMKVETSNINLSLNTFLMNDSNNISLKDLKLLKPSVNFFDNTNNIKINAQNIELFVNNLTKKKDVIAIDSIKLIEPKLDFLDTSSKTKIETKNLDLLIKKISNSNAGFKILNINLNQPIIAISLPKTINSDDLKDKKEVVTKVLEKADESKITNKSANIQTSNPSTKIDIGPLNINNGTLSFEDGNLPLPFKTTITKLNGKVSEFKNTKSGTTTLEVNGVVDQYGVAKITGTVDPNNIKILTDINMIFNNITISNFTPYSGKFIGREIKSGKLDLDLKYNIQESNLDAKNNITITKIELGKNIQSPEAVSLPLDIAISLLKDSKGVIDIKLPVTGNVDDPQFSIGSIIWNAFINLMTKAVTAPFSLLGSLFNFNESEISSVAFNLSEDKITPIQKETLDKIAQILQAKPDLAISIAPSYDGSKEENAVREKRYFQDNPNAKNLSKEDLAKYLSKEKVSEDTLKEIAQNRIKNIKEYLITEKSINDKQVILLDKIKTSSSSIDLGIQKIK